MGLFIYFFFFILIKIIILWIPIVKTFLFIRIKSLFFGWFFRTTFKRLAHFLGIHSIFGVLAYSLVNSTINFIFTTFSFGNQMMPASTGDDPIYNNKIIIPVSSCESEITTGDLLGNLGPVSQVNTSTHLFPDINSANPIWIEMSTGEGSNAEEEIPTFDWETVEMGGETLSQMAFTLQIMLPQSKYPTHALLMEHVRPLFKKNASLLLEMDKLDPEGGWLLDGAKFIRSRNGNRFTTMKSLEKILKSLEEEGTNSYYFNVFKGFKLLKYI